MKNNKTTPAPALYRADLFADAKARRGLSFATIAGIVGLSINTVKSVVDGRSDSLEKISRVGRFYDLELSEVFDTAGHIRPIG